MEKHIKKIILCSCEFRSFPGCEEKLETILATLESLAMPFHLFGDLCGICAKNPDKIREMFNFQGELVFIACYPRAVRSLLSAAEISLDNVKVTFHNWRTQTAEEILAAIVPGVDPVKTVKKEKPPAPSGDWVPWFPVIDRERCTNCGQCLSFCLFGVYAKDENGNVKVANPAGCKTDCPACARICPQTAIIFPKYGLPPINGDEVDEKNMNKDIKVENLSRMSPDQVYKMLSSRMKK